MPGSIPSMAVQKKQSVIPPSQGPLSKHAIESQRKGNGFERTENLANSKPNSQAKKTACSVNKSALISNTVTPRAAAVVNGQNVDERLKAARERREEQKKLLASRELSRLEREQRAKRYYEQQLQERKNKLLEQRHKEERRRAAVEEKRKQRLKEEKERYESAVRRTLEKSIRAQQNLSQNSRGRKLNKNVPRRLPLTTWEKNLVSRLLTPTCSYLARSKSAGCQSGEEVVHVCRRAVSFHSMNTTTTTTTTTPHKPQHHSGSVHSRPSSSPSPNKSQHRSINLAQIKSARQQDANKKKSNSSSSIRSTTVKNSVKPSAVKQSRTASPSPDRTPQRSISRHSTPLQLELPSVPEEDVAVCSSALSPGNSRPVRTSAEGRQEKMETENPPEAPHPNLPDKGTEAVTRTAGDGSPSKMPPRPAPQPPEVTCRPSAGTTDPEAASRLLAEKRREARLQREREEQERLQREETERRSREELERKRAEERARQQAEAQQLIEEKRRREEEEQRKAEEERAQAMREAALLQKQREEEQAKERAKAEQMKQERELQAQKEEAERQVRKKRLEEIMRRTRRTDSPDTKSVPARILPNEAKPKENTEPVQNGTIGDAIKLPVGSRPSQLGLNNEEDVVPVVAFKERRSLRTLTGLEEIQTHQRAEVI
ncbi:ensconsin-like isoform X1 [Thunnus albacares]|uniref:ensconsin-like isoform X1 n=1 Tax=Thunnus albacares TaxID=8236 RepID=UPI001CF634E4|nr:ensconsin-like isoform X1 [Thunnus albacares]XP_044230233.1 ensconsin-like isoform X1 [Thunnus albacares]XP_044230234.1 ensconsin-like isoform X1 [Thunnus albacares]XP_044230235.1 ensconsin-like isoform X1 [Thunnus albacares]XP_044230236.1 ensconsin-like isoform X1 [Thunnus albacares]XP_044230237.1 ensconsin-like isoform X1 [Thunnus albacares]XP_044230238.1 ensconsin-like isoform X1 [Thunnus albacares]XP_044230239.1 ensconsin-like isoform X1 [Thunnus albacares]XP_044230240.1 ensconsin-li